jgi:predicted phosphoribosyltransferase
MRINAALGIGARSVVASSVPSEFQSVILGFGAFKQLEFDEARHLVEMTVARQPDFLE